MICECAALAIFSGCDEVPDETLDILITTVVQQAIGQQCTADGLNIPFSQRTFEAAMRENIFPATPTKQLRVEVEEGKKKRHIRIREPRR